MYTKRNADASAQNSPHATKATVFVSLTAGQEALAQAIQQASTDDILQIAHKLVVTNKRHLFGDTEFNLNDARISFPLIRRQRALGYLRLDPGMI